MRLLDWLLIAACLAGGYWIVAFFLDRGKGAAAPTARPPAGGVATQGPEVQTPGQPSVQPPAAGADRGETSSK
jgi:hypothetical protein